VIGFMNLHHDDHYMRMAIQQAREALDQEEVPTGCVIISTADGGTRPCGSLIGKAHNLVEQLKDPTAHAEMIAITQAANAAGDWRLTDTVLFVTKEPCPMCAGAMLLARIPTVVFGTIDPKRGAVSVFAMLDHPNFNHRCEVRHGILEDECRSLLQDFFRSRRAGDSQGTGSD
jgi:tRNA(adenine34) deaminase